LKGYDQAKRSLQPGYTNRVMMITDALANTGVINEKMIAAVGKHYDDKRIRLSGIGVGRAFNDGLLDRLTERGRGAYVFLGSEDEVDRIFGPEFVSLLETSAVDVHFRLHLPPSLRLDRFHGEESSTEKSDVQAIHYFANTSQLFLSDLVTRGDKIRPQDSIMLTIEYRDPETEKQRIEEVAFGLGEILGDAPNVQKARLLMQWADGLEELSRLPAHNGRAAGSWSDEEGYRICSRERTKLVSMAEGSTDPEVQRVIGLWDTYCSRFERPRNPVRR